MRYVAIAFKETGKTASKKMSIRLAFLDVIDDVNDKNYGQGILIVPSMFQEEHREALRGLTKKFSKKGLYSQSVETVVSSIYDDDGNYGGQTIRLAGMHGSAKSARTFVDNLYKAILKLKGDNQLFIMVDGTATATHFDGEWDNLPAFVQSYFEI